MTELDYDRGMDRDAEADAHLIALGFVIMVSVAAVCLSGSIWAISFLWK